LEEKQDFFFVFFFNFINMNSFDTLKSLLKS